jgi:hypothetical protein
LENEQISNEEKQSQESEDADDEKVEVLPDTSAQDVRTQGISNVKSRLCGKRS